MSPRPDKSEERKDQILDAAADVFTKKGLQKTRMDDIVDKSGLSKGTLYWYFDSKDDIIIGIFERIFLKESRDLTPLITSEKSSSERIYEYTERIILDLQRLLKFAPIAFEFLSLAFRTKYFRKAFKTYLSIHMEILIPIIQQGVDAGEFRALDPFEAAVAIGAIFEGTVLLWVYDKDLIDPESHIKSGIKFLIEGFKS